MSIVDDIIKLKKEKNAVILAHYYVDDEVQEIADYVGDSFYLSKVATKISEDRIIFAGVEFMGESAKILNPSKRVFMPDASADCPMAHMATKEEILKVKEEYEDVAVVCYINSTAQLKTYADVCVTSSNAVKIVKNLPNKNIFFIPDCNLGRFVANQVPEKNVILNKGFCPRHVAITKDHVLQAKKAHPEAVLAAHPECTQDVLDLADYIGATSGIIDYVVNTDFKEYLIGTVDGVFAEIHKKAPDKKLFTLKPDQVCVNMKKVTLSKILDCLEEDVNEVFVDEDTRLKALKPLEKMLELAAK
ncbi:quinolinate synthase NadA [Lachnospira multipara]|jgi:quinolinate synthase|uniref:quinolinate synthase NadA n=1 Tax=Lachnospira multipara TaxID=28051 RepID=UPI0004E24EBA|nr:quinolinate synthase NadA [Lachnospira multipara]